MTVGAALRLPLALADGLFTTSSKSSNFSSGKTVSSLYCCFGTGALELFLTLGGSALVLDLEEPAIGLLIPLSRCSFAFLQAVRIASSCLGQYAKCLYRSIVCLLPDFHQSRLTAHVHQISALFSQTDEAYFVPVSSRASLAIDVALRACPEQEAQARLVDVPDKLHTFLYPEVQGVTLRAWLTEALEA